MLKILYGFYGFPVPNWYELGCAIHMPSRMDNGRLTGAAGEAVAGTRCMGHRRVNENSRWSRTHQRAVARFKWRL
jgi:hypothetical protein